MSEQGKETAPGSFMTQAWRWTRRVVLVVIGVPITLAGLVLLVTPGPGLPVLLAGLAILAVEFSWARNRMQDLRRTASNLIGRRAATPEPADEPHADLESEPTIH